MSNTQEKGMQVLTKHILKEKILLILSAIFSIGSAICTFIPYVMVYQVLNIIFDSSLDTQSIIQCAIYAALAIVARFILQIISGAFSHIAAFNVLYEIRMSIVEHIAKVNLGFFNQNSIGKIKKVIIEDVERTETFLAHQIPDIMAAVVAPVLLFVYLAKTNLILALCLLIPFVIGFILIGVTAAISGRQMSEYHDLIAKLNSVIMQFINGMPVMKTYNLTAQSYDEYANTVQDFNDFWKRCTKKQGYPYGAFVTLVQSGILFILPIGGYLYLQHDLAVSTYLFFMIMSMVFLNSLLNLINLGGMIHQITMGLQRIAQIFDIPLLVEGNQEIDISKNYELNYQDVSFAYNNNDVLKDIKINLKSNTLTAFVGASGAGKTTAALLALKFWEVNKGSISIDGLNINELKNENLMDLVSFVFQETFMLHDNIYQNIAIGQKNATLETVQQAAKAAQIHDFIMSLPQQYETVVGEGGTKLSGGEKQRICIARAILKDAPIIIFDEATSYTDIENEHKIQLALNELLENKTTIMIAHRLHTIVDADQICVFDHGQVVETGKHQELIAKNGLYSKMWQTYTKDMEVNSNV